jgi:hypothetical protein
LARAERYVTVTVSRWKSLRPGVGNETWMLAPQFALAIPVPVSRFGTARSAMARVWRRRLFRRVTGVCFAVAIAAAERERWGVVSRRH